jgi:large subunit ribosomal protein L6
MSRVGKLPITIPEGVEVKLSGHHVKVKGPKGVLERDLHPEIKVTVDKDKITVERSSDLPFHRALHGTIRVLINNMVVGVTKGFTRELEIHGIGYKAEMQGTKLNMNLSMSHPVVYEPPQGITIEVPGPERIRVLGMDKETVGQVAADIRAFDPPEPYKGKGIRYVGEYVKRKAGKAGAAQS